MSRKAKKKRAARGAVADNRPLPAKRDRVYAWADNLLFSGVLLILFLRPFVSGRTYPQYNHFFHMGVAVVTILWLIKCARRGTLELHNRLVTGFALAFLLACSITFFSTANKGLTLRYIYEIVGYTLLFLVIANNFRERASVKAAVATFLSSALLVNIYGLYQRYHTLELTRRHIENVMASGNQDLLMGIPLDGMILHRLGSTRVFSTFLYPNAYALFLGLTGALTIGWLWSMRSQMVEFARPGPDGIFGSGSALHEHPDEKPAGDGSGPRLGALLRPLFRLAGLALPFAKVLLLLLFAVSCVLIPWNLWLTYSRGGWAAAVVILLVFLLVRFWKSGKAGAEKAAVLIFITILSGAVFTSADALSDQKIRVHEESLLERLKDTATVTHRFSYWKASLEMIKDNPWLGVGWGAFEKAYPRYMILGGYPVKLAHNNYLQVWAETGLLGLNAFIGLWLVSIYTFWRKARTEAPAELRPIACALGAGLIGFLVHSTVDFGLYLPTIMYCVYALLGLLVAVPSRREEEDKSALRFPAAAAVISVATLCVFMVFLYRSFAALSIYLHVEEERNNAFPTQYAVSRGFQVDPQRQRKVLAASVSPLKKSIDYFPLDADSRHMLGDTYVRMAQLENAPYLLGKAKEQLERAAELNPLSPYVYQSLATAYWIDGNKNRNPEMFQKALDAELRASENFPLNPEYHRKLVQIYKSLEMKEKAQEHAQLAKKLQKHFKKN